MRGYVALLLLLAAIWGASFMFIKIAVDELAPTTTMFLRLAFSAVPLVALVVYKLGTRPAREQLLAITKVALILGIVNTALPFTHIAWGETRIDSGVAAIGNASMPIFVAILAFFFRKSETATGVRLFGILLGLAGVAVLTGVHPKGGWAGAVGRREPTELRKEVVPFERRAQRDAPPAMSSTSVRTRSDSGSSSRRPTSSI